MAKGLFQSPKKALLFVGMTLSSVAMLIGSEDNEGALIQAAASLEESDPHIDRGFARHEGPKPATAREIARDDTDEAGFADDAALIDDTAGFDPTPENTEPVLTDPADGDTYILIDESRP